MKQYNITLLRGDGIGPEIVAEAIKVLDADYEEMEIRLVRIKFLCEIAS
jgi:3-isopropylmalate dehydrogenase